MNGSFIKSRHVGLSLLLLISAHAVAKQSDKKHSATHTSTDSSSRVIRQEDLPYTIKKSGEYSLEGNVKYCKSGAAITISGATNVKLHLEGASIKLTDPRAVGISIDHSSEVTIEGDRIINTSSPLADQTGQAINVQSSNKIVINNMLFENHAQGLIVENSHNVNATGIEFSKANIAGAQVTQSSNVTFANNVFTDNAIGLLFAGDDSTTPNRACQVLDSAFPNSTGVTNLLAQQINGLVVDGSSFSSTGGTFDPETKESVTTNLAQFGDTGDSQTANDVTVRSSTFVNRSENKALEGLFLFHGLGFLVDSIIVDIDNNGVPTDAHLSGIHISSPDAKPNGVAFSNGIVRNSVFQGPAHLGVYPDGGSTGIVMENILATGSLLHGIFLAGTTNSTVKDSTSTNNVDTGILIAEESSSNAVLNNETSGNFIGINIAAGSNQNTVQYNKVFGNTKALVPVDPTRTNAGILDEGTSNAVWNNTAFNNSGVTHNYLPASAFPFSIINVPGEPTKAGANLSRP